MSKFPFSALRTSSEGLLAVASNNQIAVLDGCVVPKEKTTLILIDSTKVVTSSEGHSMPVRLLAFSTASKQLISTGDDKQLCVWNIEHNALTLHDSMWVVFFDDLLTNHRPSPLSKRSNSLNLLNDSTILVGDKFGDLFAYKLNRSEEDKAKDAQIKNKDKEPLLGHVSMVNDVAVTPSQIISADRDAHIRVSRSPLGYVIDSFCLGHAKFITAIALLDENLLLSGGGDDCLILWEYKQGKELRRFDVSEAVLAHGHVRAIKIQDKMLKSDNIPADYGEHMVCIDRILVSGGDDPLVLFTSCGCVAVFLWLNA